MSKEGNTLERLERVASKQEEWRKLAVSRKLELLDEILACIHKIGIEGWMANARGVAQLFQVPLSTPLGEYIVAEETLLCLNQCFRSVSALQDAYKIRTGQGNPTLTQLEMSKTINGQVKAKVFPLRPFELYGPLGQGMGEVWFDANVDMEQIKPFDFESLENPTHGALLVLGAGNHDFLTVVDVLQGLFAINQVVYVKLHPLRNHFNTILRQTFAPLIREGYFDTEVHESLERSAQLVYSELVGAVHMTGGKATHDAIVWGADPDERKDRIARQDPKLKARMSSELGCVTPWIIAGEEYTSDELKHQSKSVAWAIRFRGSANCNSPNTVVMAKSWSQRDEFVESVLQVWKDHEAPIVYYPGAKERWQGFVKAYPSSLVVESKPREDDETEAFLKRMSLPLLVVSIDVDITTTEGIEKAKSEYAFSHEAFAPVLVLVVIDDTKEGARPFLELASKFCNQFLFGTLSCQITMPPSLEGSEEAEQTIADLRYGTVAVNIYAGMTFSISSLAWGAIPGERLNNVQSGIGKVQNRLFLPHIEKCVFRTPIICPGHLAPKDQSPQDAAAERLGIAKFLLSTMD
jgi:hypothetical protein